MEIKNECFFTYTVFEIMRGHFDCCLLKKIIATTVAVATMVVMRNITAKTTPIVVAEDDESAVFSCSVNIVPVVANTPGLAATVLAIRPGEKNEKGSLQ